MHRQTFYSRRHDRCVRTVTERRGSRRNEPSHGVTEVTVRTIPVRQSLAGAVDFYGEEESFETDDDWRCYPALFHS